MSSQVTGQHNVQDWTRRYLGLPLLEARPPLWLEESYRAFEAIVADDRYPCYFGTRALREDLYVTGVEATHLESLPEIIAAFVEISRSIKRRNNLAVFFRPLPLQTEHVEYQELFWRALQYLHDRDPLPEAVPAITVDDPHWEFPFAGEQFFVVAASPSYRNRRSRNLGPSFVMIFQPRDVFDGADTREPLNTAARETIRKRLTEWDRIGPHPELGTFGDPDNREWRQYFLPDDADRGRGKCPLRMHIAR